MSRLEMVRAAVGELGAAAPADQIVAFVEQRFGQPIEARFVPVYLATLRAEAEHRLARERAARIVAEGVGRPARRPRKGAG